MCIRDRSSGAMTNRLDNLEEGAYVRRIPDHEDRRRVRVALTTAGRELIDATMDQHVAELEGHLGLLDADDYQRLTGLLRRILVEFERDPDVRAG